MSGTLLPIPDDPRVAALFEVWPELRTSPGVRFPRSRWLRAFEVILREHYPQANSRSLQLTARSVAPFPLRDGPNVP